MKLPGPFARHSKFIGHVATMMSGKTAAATIALFTTPVIARLFEPNDFGVAAVFMSVLGIASNVASLRYEMALVLPRREQEALALMAFSYRVLLGFCIAMLAVIVIVKFSNVTWSNWGLLGPWIWLLPPSVLIMAGLQIQDGWLTRKSAFHVMSASLVCGTVVGSAFRIGLGWWAGTSVYALIIGNLLGLVSRLVVQRNALIEGLNATLVRMGWSEMRRIAKQYADFPTLNAPAGLVFSLGQNLPVLLFGMMFSPSVAGLYAMANRLAQVPVTIVANSMRRVFLQKAAAITNSRRDLRKAFVLSTGGLAALGAIPFTIVWLYGQPISSWLLGERWITAGRYLEIIAPWMFMIWVTAPSNPVFIVFRKQKLWLSMQIVLTILRLGSFGVAYIATAGPEGALMAFVAVSVICNIATVLLAFTLISRRTTGCADPTADEQDARVT